MRYQRAMDWGSPAARLALIEMIGVVEYGHRLAAAQKAAEIEVVNGYTLRWVQTGFGPLVSVVGTRDSFKTIEAARDYARSLRGAS